MNAKWKWSVVAACLGLFAMSCVQETLRSECEMMLREDGQSCKKGDPTTCPMECANGLGFVCRGSGEPGTFAFCDNWLPCESVEGARCVQGFRHAPATDMGDAFIASEAARLCASDADCESSNETRCVGYRRFRVKSRGLDREPPVGVEYDFCGGACAAFADKRWNDYTSRYGQYEGSAFSFWWESFSDSGVYQFGLPVLEDPATLGLPAFVMEENCTPGDIIVISEAG